MTANGDLSGTSASSNNLKRPRLFGLKMKNLFALRPPDYDNRVKKIETLLKKNTSQEHSRKAKGRQTTSTTIVLPDLSSDSDNEPEETNSDVDYVVEEEVPAVPRRKNDERRNYGVERVRSRRMEKRHIREEEEEEERIHERMKRRRSEITASKMKKRQEMEREEANERERIEREEMERNPLYREEMESSRELERVREEWIRKHGNDEECTSYPPPTLHVQDCARNHGRMEYAQPDIPPKWSLETACYRLDRSEYQDIDCYVYHPPDFQSVDRSLHGRRYEDLIDGEKWLLRNNGINPKNGMPNGGIWRKNVLYWRGRNRPRYEEYQPGHKYPQFKWEKGSRPITLESQQRERESKMAIKRAAGRDSDTTDNDEYTDAEPDNEDLRIARHPLSDFEHHQKCDALEDRIHKRWRLKRRKCNCPESKCSHFEDYRDKNNLFYRRYV